VPRQTAPPPGKALINIHYANSKPKTEGFNLWDGQGHLVGKLRTHTLNQLAVDPGDHLLIAGDGEPQVVLKVSTQAGRVYDVKADYDTGGEFGWKVGVDVLLIPVPTTGPLRDEVTRNESDLTTVAVNRAAPTLQKQEAASAASVRKVIADFTTGPYKDRLTVLAADQYRH